MLLNIINLLLHLLLLELQVFDFRQHTVYREIAVPGTAFADAVKHPTAVDLTAPVVTLTAPANGATLTSGGVSFNGIAGITTGDSNSVTVKVYAGANTSGTRTFSS